MNSRRYRFCKSIGETHDTIEGESCALLDSAIERAKELSVALVINVYLVDCDSPPFRVRGIAEGRKWSWMKTCGACAGTGKFTYRARATRGQTPPAPQVWGCQKCFGHGVVVDQQTAVVA